MISLRNDVSDVKPNPDLNSAGLGDSGIALSEARLDFKSAACGLDGAAELDQKTVAGRFYFASAEHGKNITEEAAMFFQQIDGQTFVALDEGAVADHIGEHDGGQTAVIVFLRTHGGPKISPGTRLGEEI
jgi:hypothetical protein